jgi:hypothetical protein
LRWRRTLERVQTTALPNPLANLDPRRVLRGAGLVACAAWLPVLILWGPAPFTVTFDDAYYYFAIARHVAAGHGSTFDGINHTNGYHPLWLVVCVLPYLLGLGQLVAVRFVLVVQLVLWALTLWMVATVVGDAVDGFPRLSGRSQRTAAVALAVVFFIAAANPFVMKTFVNGLESGIAAVAAAGLLVLACRRGQWLPGESRRAQLGAGAVFAVAFLARTDAVFFIGAALVWSVLASRGHERRELLLTFAVPAVVAAAYLASNRLLFGSPLQVSGVVKRLPLTGARTIGMLMAGIVALAIVAAVRNLGSGTGRFARTRGLLATTGWFAAGCVLLVAYYRLLSVETYLWYYAPLVLYGIVLVMHVAADLLEGAAVEAPAGRVPHRQILLFAALLAAPLVAASIVSGRSFIDPGLRSLMDGDRAVGIWLGATLPRGQVAASWDAGVIGYFADRPVVNLDGLVNSFEFNRARRQGPSATSRFLDRERVTYIVNHGPLVNGVDPDIGRSLDVLLGPGAGTRAQEIYRVEYFYSGASAGKRGRRRWATFAYVLRGPRSSTAP